MFEQEKANNNESKQLGVQLLRLAMDRRRFLTDAGLWRVVAVNGELFTDFTALSSSLFAK